MIKIAIELNGILRNLNQQIVKYYKKDIDKSFDEDLVDENSLNIIDKLGFKTKKDKFNFMYVDYPYEIFGCAKTMSLNLSNDLNNFIIKLNEYDKNEYEIAIFSLKEEGLSIQSTFHFLSKIGCRIRTVLFPKDGKKMWEDYDIIITNNERIIKNKPNNKIAILIRNHDTQDLEKKSDLVYDKLEDFINTDKIFELKLNNKSNNILQKIKKLWKK